MRVAVACCTGRLQRGLVRRVAARHQLVAVVWQHRPAGGRSWRQRLLRYRNPLEAWRQLAARAWLPRFEAVARPWLEAWFPDSDPLPPCPSVTVANVNEPAAVELLRTARPEVVLVNGTLLLREPMLALAEGIRHGFVNLHTGLSPYTRGGNCNLFAVLEGHPEWLGFTVHHVDPGIDSGDIILSGRLLPDASDNFETVDLQSFHYGYEALLQAVDELAAGVAPRVRQWQSGRLYLKRTGHVYSPWLRLRANQALRRWLAHGQKAGAAEVRTIGRVAALARLPGQLPESG